MGNREDLLAGALACLKTKGWTRTTVRDIAAAAGVNHAAIGYHFGSREALLIEAFTQAMDAWGAQTEAAVRAAEASVENIERLHVVNERAPAREA